MVMNMVRVLFLFGFLAAALAGCAVPEQLGGSPKPANALAAPAQTPALLGAGQSAAALDQTTEAEKIAARKDASAAEGRALGRVVVALGSPVEQGFWLKSALIVAPAKGRVVTDSGAAVAVDLLPGSGAALLSLAAFLALGLGLTELPEVTVFRQ